MPDRVLDIVPVPLSYRGRNVICYYARLKGDILAWVTHGELDPVYRVKVYLKDAV